ncbi:hypothetical protein PoB_003702900 [Plakobranchus ocellatus]|uniref:Uncharacterized protein n=1 Tax=Plakobranchus ocellatus TaxID=259542 RepID=A0AAV4AVV8_9GAST|nr:hypothetical protein PoB_003702900 [Plakobranchus ocellatus]
MQRLAFPNAGYKPRIRDYIMLCSTLKEKKNCVQFSRKVGGWGEKIFACRTGLSSPDASNSGDADVQQCGGGELVIPTILTRNKDQMVGWELRSAAPSAKFYFNLSQLVISVFKVSSGQGIFGGSNSTLRKKDPCSYHVGFVRHFDIKAG